MGEKLDELEHGQTSIRRDIARVERKIDRLSNDAGDKLAIITEATDYALSKIREAGTACFFAHGALREKPRSVSGCRGEAAVL